MPNLTIIEPNTDIRKQLKKAIETTPGWRVVGNHACTSTALPCAVAEAPDVVIIDINLPKVNGLDGLRKLRRQLSKAHFIVFTNLDDKESMMLALNFSAGSYVLKKEGRAGLHQALRLARERKSYLSPEIVTLLVNSQHQRPLRQGILRRLTSRQLQITRMVHSGMSYCEIALQIGISEQGVRQHLRRIYQRVRVKNRAELTALYGRMIRGEITEEE